MAWNVFRCRLRGDTGGRPGLPAGGRGSCAPVRRCSKARILGSEAFRATAPLETDVSRAGSMTAADAAARRAVSAELPLLAWVWLTGACDGAPAAFQRTIAILLSVQGPSVLDSALTVVRILQSVSPGTVGQSGSQAKSDGMPHRLQARAAGPCPPAGPPRWWVLGQHYEAFLCCSGSGDQGCACICRETRRLGSLAYDTAVSDPQRLQLRARLASQWTNTDRRQRSLVGPVSKVRVQVMHTVQCGAASYQQAELARRSVPLRLSRGVSHQNEARRATQT